MISVATACIILSSYFQQPNKPLTAKSKPNVTKSLPKPFKVSGLPFEMNGMHLQYQYTLKKNPDTIQKEADYYGVAPKHFMILDKKLIDLKRHTVVFEFGTDGDDDQYPTIDLSDITHIKPGPRDFDDVNFDGYKDIREDCNSCSGAQNQVEYIYLFNPRTKKFVEWKSVLGVGVTLDDKEKTVSSYEKNGRGEIRQQEIKFADHGVELYRKEVSCTMFNEKKLLYKLTYDKYIGKKLVVHKTKIVTDAQIDDVWDIVDNIKKDKK